jgi:FAD/FMN-containing dehydrogenase/Fe-S oxidoreductase
MKKMHHAPSPLDPIRNLLSGQLLTDPLSLAMYSSDASIYQIRPTAVILPASENDVQTVVKFCDENNLSIIPRGAGTGLAGESVGPGVILDFTRYMNRLIRIDPDANTATVEPGLVLDTLNQALAKLCKKIGPDPASGNRATLGGMIGNNSTGAHSLKYGYVSRHLKNLRMVAADAQLLEFQNVTIQDNPSDPSGQWAKILYTLIAENKDLLRRTRPTCKRNNSGYNIFDILKTDGQINLAELIAGSEGTLGIITHATIGLVDLPKHKALLQINFESLGTMARAVPYILEHDPSACELMDGFLLRMARDAYPQYLDVLPDVGAQLLVEFDADNESQLLKKLELAEKMVRGLPPAAACLGTQQIIDPKWQSRISIARNAATPLLYREKSALYPIPVIEDIAVNPCQLAEYLDRVQEITTRHGAPVAYYAHAGDGELHIRPFLDLHNPDEVVKMRQLEQEVFELVWSLGGTISGEHGEGLVRSSFIEKQYGPEVYEIFRKIKCLFDPKNCLNPGKIITDDPATPTNNLRFSHPLVHKSRPTNLIFKPGEFVTEIEQCNGNGLCRSLDSTLSMCPVFRATGDEKASPRGKANLMRHWLYGLLDADVMQSQAFKEIADLCINCKSCSRQCPSLVNIPKLMLEARAEYVKHQGLTRPEFVLTRGELISRLGSAMAPLANMFLRMGWFRRMMELGLGLDHRRPFPKFEFRSNLSKLRKYLAQLPLLHNPSDKVAYFVDMYAAYNDHALGRAIVDVLRHNNIEVIIPEQRGMAMPAISYGDLGYAKKIITTTVRPLAMAARAGYKIICSEPTAALCFREEYLDVIDSEDVRLVAKNTFELTDYLAALAADNKFNTDFKPVPMKLAYHIPCHYQALELKHNSMDLLQGIPELQIERLPVNCCGIAGTFGFQKKGFDLSLAAGKSMLEALKGSPAPFGLTECSTCKMQMEFGSGKTVLHPAKVLAKAYGLM